MRWFRCAVRGTDEVFEKGPGAVVPEVHSEASFGLPAALAILYPTIVAVFEWS